MEHLAMWLAIMAVIAAGARHLARHGRSNPRTSALRKWPTEIHHPAPPVTRATPTSLAVRPPPSPPANSGDDLVEAAMRTGTRVASCPSTSRTAATAWQSPLRGAPTPTTPTDVASPRRLDMLET